MAISNDSARVVDIILSSVVQGYKDPAFVGHELFPAIPVSASGGQVIEFGREDFLKYNARRSPGAATKRVEIGYAGKPFSLVQDRLEGTLPLERMRDAKVIPGIDLGSRTSLKVMKRLKRILEIDHATLATTPANYPATNTIDLAGAWSDKVNGAPLLDIANAMEAVRQQVGIEPNVVLMSASAFKACRMHPSVRSSYMSNPNMPLNNAQVSAEMLAGSFGVEKVVVGKSIVMNDQFVSADIWGNNVVLAYVAQDPSAEDEPSFGYTYTMEGNPAVEQPYMDRNVNSWIYPVMYERAPVLSGITSGYLIQNPA